MRRSGQLHSSSRLALMKVWMFFKCGGVWTTKESASSTAGDYYRFTCAIKINNQLSIWSFSNLWNFRLDVSLEYGFSQFLGLKMNELLLLRIIQNIEIYNNLKDFAEEVSRKVSPDIKLDNIQNLFVYFASILMLVLLGFIMEKFLFKKLHTASRKLIRHQFRILKRRFKFSNKFAVCKREFNLGLSSRPSRMIMASSRRFPVPKNYWTARPAVPRSRWKHRIT